MDKHKIITISRQYGSGGRIVGKLLAERLGIPFYDNEIISLAAEKTGLSKECFVNAEETSTGNLLLSLTTLTPSVESFGLPLNEKIFLVQSQVIKEVAEKGSCVIVGRSADYILSETENCINVFLQADLKDRINRAVAQYDLPEKNAEAAVIKTDKRRANYYNYFTGLKWGAADNYDLILNTSRMELEKIVDVIEKYVSLI
ncbi:MULTISPECIES: AAA family ATPase [Anaerotignum]|uniref:cytidylate kinase-like family protein n=1 Tax=Anaerotignum TaxID=2039240 RepID=UPI002108C1A6|nr:MULTISPECIES: cytidylate kinase-like family protein [Anaerotignum]MCQ4934994.1 cytidylate kinase-like family protein [Anaerotignum propionicum]